MRTISFAGRYLGMALLLAPCFFAGCSGQESDDTAELAPSGGMVTLDGDPVAYAAVTLHPTTGSSGAGAFGTTDETGMFTLKNPRGREGAEAGSYKATISKFAMEDGSPFPPDADPGDFAAMGKEHMPSKYSDPERTQLTVEIPPGGKPDLHFELTSE
jgi:hypothetical protein